MAKKKQKKHIIIVGGGLVGLAIARALSHLLIDITLIEATPPDFQDADKIDCRSLALSYGSKVILDNMGVWPYVADVATNIDQVHISDQGGFGFTRVSAAAEDLPTLGYVVPFAKLHQALLQALRPHDTAQTLQAHIEILCPATVASIAQTDAQVTVEVALDEVMRKLTADFVLAADGVNSTVASLLNCKKNQANYHQVAIVGNVALKRAHQHIAYERFTPDGPLAFLPQQGRYVGFTWVVAREQIDALISMPDEEFLAKLQDTFGYRLGKMLSLGHRAQFPLSLQEIVQPVQQRVLILGNAAHNVHPVAGQGFNLSLRDVAKLTACFEQGFAQWDPAMLTQFATWQAKDQRATILLTDIMVKTFSNQIPGLRLLRNIGLRFFERNSLARKLLNDQLMGLKGHKSHLECQR